VGDDGKRAVTTILLPDDNLEKMPQIAGYSGTYFLSPEE
jgi:hypothetical protein